jgi:drug/metabolite transporter (DMT)-like permease
LSKHKIIPILEVTFAVTAWGASFVATKVALQYISPVTIVWLRFAMGVLILGVAVLARKQFAMPSRKDVGYFALLGFLGITLHQWLQSTGLVTAQATTMAWIVATTPIFMALLGWIVLKETLGWVQVSGILLASMGVLVVVTRGDVATLASGKFGTTGDFLALVSSLNWAVFSALSRRGLQQHPATRMMFFVMSFGWLFSTLLFFTGPGIREIGRLTSDGWSSVIFLGVVVSGLAYIAWYDALQAFPVAQAGAFVYFEPFITVVVAAIVLGEPLLLASLAGGVGILLGVWLVNQAAYKKQEAPE